MKSKLLFAIILAALLCWGCGVQEVPETTRTKPAVQPLPQETSQSETMSNTGMPVDTPCGTIYLPDDWDLPITTETELGEMMVITFFAEDVKLYELRFSEERSDCIGIAHTDGGSVYVGMTLFPLPEESELLISMQESVNVLLEQLKLTAPEPIAPEPEDDEFLHLKTAYGMLVFPAEWEAFLVTEQPSEEELEFCCCLPDHEPVLLFTVVFGTADDGIPANVTDECGNVTPLSIRLNEPDFDDGWSSRERDLVYAMQEDMNVLLDALQQ